MNRLFRLGPVLRARRAQEDAANGAVVQSRAEVRDAAALVRRRQLELSGGDAPTEGTARAVVASLVARQSLAASLSGAHQMVADAEDVVREKVAELADAAKRRRAIELMAERHAETIRTRDIAADQAVIDELAVTSKQRAAARGVDGVSERRSNTLRQGSGRSAAGGAAQVAGSGAVQAASADAVAPGHRGPQFSSADFRAADQADAQKRTSIDLAAAQRTPRRKKPADGAEQNAGQA